MNRSSRFAAPFRLGPWTVRPDLNRVSGPDGDVRLEPRVMAVLVRLAADHGQVVGRLDLLDAVWGDAVVGEEILTRAISELRRIFGDSAREPRYIETIINNGYRLVAAVEPVEDEEPSPAPPAVAPPGDGSAPSPPLPSPPVRRAGPRWWAALPVLAAAALVIAFIAGRGARTGDGPAVPGPGARSVPVTAFPGHERQPALAADGRRVAFAWAGPDGSAEGIWIKQDNAEEPLRIGGGPGLASWPAWSPDGQSVAWVQWDGGQAEIRVTSSIGGAARTLATVPGAVVGLDWRPDGRLAFAARDTASGLHRLRVLDPATRAVRELDSDAPAGAGEVQPRLAPDGRRLAWIRLYADGTSSLCVGDADGAHARTVLDGRSGLAGLAWSSDGQRIIAGVDHAGGYGLWAIDPDGSAPPRRLTERSEFAWNPTVATATGALVYEEVRVDQDLWRVRILGRDPWQVETGRLAASSRWEYEAEFSPDGRRLAFVSARSGSPELWVGDADGGALQRLTDTGDAAVSRPRWAPDGSGLAFTIQDWERARVAWVPASGGPIRDLTPPGEWERLVGWWDADGGRLLVEHGRGSDAHLALRPVTGGDLAAAPALPAGLLAWDPSGLCVADGGGIIRWRSGAAEPVVPGLRAVDHDAWRPAGPDILWVMRAGGHAFLMLHAEGRDATATDAIVTDLPGFAGGNLAVAPDGSAVVYPRLGAAEGDLMRLVNP